jgi:hypothetical protein
MYRQFGGSAFLLLVLSAFVSNVGGAGHLIDRYKTAKDGEAKPSDEKPADAIDADAKKCAVVEILRRHYGQAEDEPEQAADNTVSDLVCQRSAFDSLPPKLPDFHPEERGMVLIATVPDPLQTANALEFDRDIEALQEAATTSGYDFESIFTEWDLSSLEEPKDSKDGRKAEHYRRLFGDQPGAMLFHRRPHSNADMSIDSTSQSDGELLLLILVPESPTYGLNMHAAYEALSAVTELQKRGFSSGPPTLAGEIVWIGPNYSASAYGLEQLAAKSSSRFNVFSGSITSKTAIDSLKMVDGGCIPQQKEAGQIDFDQHDLETMQKSGISALSGEARSPFEKKEALDCRGKLQDNEVTALESDDHVLEILRSSGVLGRGWKESVVLLQEDESSYGSGVVGEDTSNQVPTFHFPRGISHVRGAFGSQYTNYRPKAGEAPAAQDSKSLFDLTDTLQQPLDTAPEFSAQSPYSSEGELSAIAASLEHRNASALIILATDPLDNLFLARYFRQKDPDTRIVLFGAERLVPDLRRQYDLDGTIAITRFPLFEDSSLHTPTVAHHSLTFMNSTQEGIFFAALHQINPYPIFGATSTGVYEQMPTWIGVASGGSFWPLRRFGGQTVDPKLYTAASSYIVRDVPKEPLPQTWTICALLVLLCAAAHFALFLAGQPLNEKMRGNSQVWIKTLACHRILTFYLPCTPQAEHVQEFEREFGRRYWMLTATGQLFLVLCYLLVPAAVLAGAPCVPHSISDFGPIMFYALAVVLIVVSCVHFFWLLIDLFSFYRSPLRPRNLPHPYIHKVFPAGTLLWLGGSLVFFLHRLSESADGWIFAFRCVHLASGVSPVVPLLLASLGFITAAVVNLNAFALARDRNPQTPDIGLEMLKLAPCKDQLVSFIECWGILPNPQGYALSFFVLVWLVIVNPFLIFGSLDGAGMTIIFAMNVVFGLWTIAWLWVRFLCIWSLLRFILEALEGSPLRFAFSRLPKVFSLDPIWSYAGLRRTLILPMRWFEYFKVTPQQYNYDKHFRRESIWLDKISEQLFRDQALIDGDYIHFSRDQNQYASTLALTLPAVKASWDRGGPDAELGEVGETSGVNEHGGIRSRVDVPPPCGGKNAKDCPVAIANEYIAMRYGAYIRYVTLQLKNLMTFMSIGLLFFLLATVSYPFRGPRSIAWSLVVLVIILLFGVGTVLIQMDRDSILSRMSETPPGTVNRGAFLLHMLSVGGLPALTALSALFPSVGNFLFSWLQPLLSTLH